jgi:hypothetical protein
LGSSALFAYAQTPKAGEMKLEPYVFESADKQKVDAKLGHLFVPENRRNPNSRLIELVFVRFKSTAQKPGPPIVYLAGGPSGSGIAAARGSRFPLFMAMREKSSQNLRRREKAGREGDFTRPDRSNALNHCCMEGDVAHEAVRGRVLVDEFPELF